jgi:flagellar protein FliL
MIKNITLKTIFAFAFISLSSMSLAEEGVPAGNLQPYVALQPEFVVNYGSDRKVRYLKATISLRVSDASAETQVNHHSDAIRHEIILALSRQSANEIMDPENKIQLRKEISASIQKILKVETGMKLVTDLLFTDWIVQR